MPDPSTIENDRMTAASDSLMPTAAQRTSTAAAGLVLRVGGHKWTVPLATIATACAGAATIAWNAAGAYADGYARRLEALEKTQGEHSRQIELDHAGQVEIRTSLTRIEARIAEVQVILMRHGRD